MDRMSFVPKAPVPVMGLANPFTRREWTQRKGMKVYAFEELKRPFRLGVTIPLMPIPELIRTKTGTGRQKDKEDIESLRFIQSVRMPRRRT